jgi:hypothetical protein
MVVQNLSRFEHYAPLPVGIVNTLGQRNPKIEQTHSDWMRSVGKSHLDKRSLWRVGVSEHLLSRHQIAPHLAGEPNSNNSSYTARHMGRPRADSGA